MTVVEARNLSKRYGERYAVHDLSFQLESGCVTGFLGPNGAGKSTTMRLMLNLEAGGGETQFDGLPYRDLRCPSRCVGVLLDATAFHPYRTARNHLAMMAAGSRLPARRADEVLELVGLHSAASGRVRTFSLGMRQRLALAAALIGEPDVLVLDEPGNGMDPQGLSWLRDFLRQFAANGGTAFVSSHLLSTVEVVADRVIVIGRGRLVADSALDEFLRRHRVETVQVRTEDPAGLAQALDRAGGVIRDRVGDLLVVAGVTPRAVAQVAMERGLLVYELVPTTVTLEDAFMDAAAESVEFDVVGSGR